MISYWCRLKNNNNNNDTNNKLSTKLYKILLALKNQRRVKSKWLDYIQSLIETNGFNNIWLNQDSVNLKWFSLAFKRNIIDQYFQTWSSTVHNSTHFMYKTIKHNIQLNKYFTIIPNYYCQIITRFRTRNHKCPIEVGRYHNIPINERICFLCNHGIGDEYHYILECHHFNDSRIKYIKPYYYNNHNTLKFDQLFNTENKIELIKLSKFIEIITKTVKTYYT